MAKGMYVGVNNLARKVKKIYVGVDGKARKVKKVYIGDTNGKARLAWSGGLITSPIIRTYAKTTYDGGTNWTANTNTAGMSSWNKNQWFSITRISNSSAGYTRFRIQRIPTDSSVATTTSDHDSRMYSNVSGTSSTNQYFRSFCPHIADDGVIYGIGTQENSAATGSIRRITFPNNVSGACDVGWGSYLPYCAFSTADLTADYLNGQVLYFDTNRKKLSRIAANAANGASPTVVFDNLFNGGNGRFGLHGGVNYRVAWGINSSKYRIAIIDENFNVKTYDTTFAWTTADEIQYVVPFKDVFVVVVGGDSSTRKVYYTKNFQTFTLIRQNVNMYIYSDTSRSVVCNEDTLFVLGLGKSTDGINYTAESNLNHSMAVAVPGGNTDHETPIP